jgi:hypothetical protein
MTEKGTHSMTTTTTYSCGHTKLRCTVCVREALQAGVSLRGANLTGADLTGADLTRANLTGAILPKGMAYHAIQRVGSRGDTLTYWRLPGEPTGIATTGCFRGTLAELEAAVERTHGDSHHGRQYRAAITMLRALDAEAAA